jgi:hypothetical protein
MKFPNRPHVRYKRNGIGEIVDFIYPTSTAGNVYLNVTKSMDRESNLKLLNKSTTGNVHLNVTFQNE